MNELIAFAAPMLALAAIACGWLADAVSPSRGYGFLVDMGMGLAGAVALVSVLYSVGWLAPVGLLVTFLVGVVGGAGAIVAQRVFWKGPALAT